MWFKVDDSFPQHPKVLAIPRRDRAATIGLWALAGIWCSQQLTDGYLAEHMVEELAGTRKQADLLVKVNLWEPAEGGYQIHDYLDYNPSADEVRADQARKHEAKVKAGRAGGVASGAARRKHMRSSDEAEPKQDRSETKPRPDPTRPGSSSTSIEGGSLVSRGSASAPPLFPDHCEQHANDPKPGNCGGCADARKANAVQAERLPDYRMRVIKPLCGECDERWIETPDGLAKCPRCYPQEVAS